VKKHRFGDVIDLTVDIVRPKRASRKTVLIEISGLAKYLISVDRLTCSANIQTDEDMFRVWDLIEDALTEDSQFFTLIDIYGHYANRGDTVKVSTVIKTRTKSTLDKAFEFFGSSGNCGVFIPVEDIDQSIAVGGDSIAALVSHLRSLRWDIRTPDTHSTIREHAILCTYPFPLLSDKAQLERRAALAR